MNERAYAEAVLELSKSGTSADALVGKLVAHLKARGRLKLLPGIVRRLKVMEARAAVLEPSLEVARKENAAGALRAAREAGIDAAEARVNSDLIRGWRARSGGALVDRSGKRQLIELYRNITG